MTLATAPASTASVSTGSAPVSYTHLDVYKRQTRGDATPVDQELPTSGPGKDG